MKSFVLATVLSLAASLASAATVSFSLTGTTATLPSVSLTNSGVTLTVSGLPGNVHRNGNGLGVAGGANGSRLGLGEILSFNFSEAVTSISAGIFETGSENEQFAAIINGIPTTFVVPGGGTGGSVVTFNFAGLYPVTSFVLLGLEPNATGNRGVRINNLTVTTIDPLISAVPLPASGVLLLGALGALALRRKR